MSFTEYGVFLFFVITLFVVAWVVYIYKLKLRSDGEVEKAKHNKDIQNNMKPHTEITHPYNNMINILDKQLNDVYPYLLSSRAT